MKNFLIPIFASSCFVSMPALAQQSGAGFGDTGGGGGALLQLSADGTCWDDCWVESTPLHGGTVIAIMKNGQVVDQGYVDAPLEDIGGDAPDPPPGGSGSKSDSWQSHGWNAAGEPGAWITTIRYTYSENRLRNTGCEVEWVPDMDPPADEEGGG